MVPLCHGLSQQSLPPAASMLQQLLSHSQKFQALDSTTIGRHSHRFSLNLVLTLWPNAALKSNLFQLSNTCLSVSPQHATRNRYSDSSRDRHPPPSLS